MAIGPPANHVAPASPSRCLRSVPARSRVRRALTSASSAAGRSALRDPGRRQACGADPANTGGSHRQRSGLRLARGRTIPPRSRSRPTGRHRAIISRPMLHRQPNAAPASARARSVACSRPRSSAVARPRERAARRRSLARSMRRVRPFCGHTGTRCLPGNAKPAVCSEFRCGACRARTGDPQLANTAGPSALVRARPLIAANRGFPVRAIRRLRP